MIEYDRNDVGIPALLESTVVVGGLHLEERLLGRPWLPAFAKKAGISNRESKNKEKDLE